jgi:DNA-binding Xre family transcriptional regulator
MTAASRRVKKTEVGYRWHLRQLMADRGMYATSDLAPLLADRGITLSREQVYRLVARTPERLNLRILAALCDIFDCGPGDLIEPVSEASRSAAERSTSKLATLRPQRARVAPAER